jgi:hypothetical protein
MNPMNQTIRATTKAHRWKQEKKSSNNFSKLEALNATLELRKKLKSFGFWLVLCFV